eukprot:tig00000430_g630.t1
MLDYGDRMEDGFFDPGREHPALPALAQFRAARPPETYAREALLFDGRTDRGLQDLLRAGGKAAPLGPAPTETELKAASRALAVFCASQFGFPGWTPAGHHGACPPLPPPPPSPKMLADVRAVMHAEGCQVVPIGKVPAPPRPPPSCKQTKASAPGGGGAAAAEGLA